ncbi:protein kinase domain-containing protein [Candidatus Avelusimicrobium stercoris]|uniref:serine/threonine-protein kinase n=1 Tax=Candidatus Avelusimicrobium stercoris TaxID=1947924 RepID=UPI003D13037D
MSFEEIVSQFLDECQKGLSPQVADYQKRYPQYAQRLAQVLPLSQELEKLHPKPETPPEQEQLDDYRLLSKIGAGGMGVVYEALQVSLNRRVAVKLLSRNFVTDEEQRKQFENEALIIARLHHPNIVQVLSAKCTPQRCYYAMELIRGTGLHQYAFKNLREIAQAGLQASEALAYAHSCKVLHRDIKPANLLIDEKGHVYVSDFGIAFLTNEPGKTPADPRSGTIRYMAPEKLLRAENTFATDQYSFGATLYELITREPFIAGNSYGEISQKISAGEIPQLTCAEPDLSAIVNKCTRVNPAERYGSMAEVADDLKHFLHSEPVHAAHTSWVRRFVLWRRRSPAAALFSLLAAFCGVAFVLALLIGYVNTNKALKLARQNASTADAALSKIFTYVQTQTPSSGASALLGALMPYYQEISTQQKVSPEKRAQVSQLVGQTAELSGNYALAEQAFREVQTLRPSAASLNQLAQVLEKAGKKKEAISLRQTVAKNYIQADNKADRYEAVRALLALPQEEALRRQAFDALKQLLAQAPQNADYLYAYARLVGENPRLFASERIPGVEPNAVVLLNRMSEKYPQRVEYGLSAVELMTRKLRYSQQFQARDFENLQLALSLSDRLLGQFPNTPRVVSSVVALRNSAVRLMRREGDFALARKETERLLGMLELLFYNPQTPDDVKETLLTLQLDRLEMFVRDGRTSSAEEIKKQIQTELQDYWGDNASEFARRLSAITTRSPR